MTNKDHTTSQLAKLRAQVGISQGGLSKLAGVHVMKISKIERGVTKMENLTLKNAIALADALGIVDLRELLADKQPRDQAQKK